MTSPPGRVRSSGSQFLLAPDRHLGIAVLANMSSLEKAEIAQDTLAIMLGGEPAARPARPDWRQSTFAPDRAVWANYVGEYQTSDGSIACIAKATGCSARVAG